jgi:DNA invertase Pin-like site-specific DNA recombinase
MPPPCVSNGIVRCGQVRWRPPARQRTLRAKGASLKTTEIGTSTAAGKCFLDMLGVFAEFETNLRRERQLEGIAKAKAAGVYKGRPASIDETRVRELKAQGMRAHRYRQDVGHWPHERVSGAVARSVNQSTRPTPD